MFRARSLHPRPDWLISRANELRRNPTAAEVILLSDLVMRGFVFQKPYLRYILDFYHPRTKVNVELDGKTHFTKKGKRKNSDQLRDRHLARDGVLVLRYDNKRVFGYPKSILDEIDQIIRIRSGVDSTPR